MRNLFFTVLQLLVTTGIAQIASPYSFKKGSADGIGKWYMGREIAHVMGHQGISWLERSDREDEEKVSLLLANLAIKPGEVIADIGAGSGYHTRRMAMATGKNGKVYAVDIQPEMLEFMKEKHAELGINNVSLVLNSPKDAKLAPKSIDKMLLVDVYHEFDFPYEMARSLFESLRPGGKLFLIEYRGEDPDVPIKPLHKMTVTQAKKELEAVGFFLEKNITNLPWQHCLVFGRR